MNNEFKCAADLPKAVGNGLLIATNVKTEAIADGKTKSTKTDKLTEYSCKGSAACTTKTTTSVTTIIKNGAGQTESTTGTCSGPHCPDKNTNPDGDGDGFGDCTGDQCGQEEEGGGAQVTMPELAEVDGYKETVQKFFDRASDAPIVQAVTGLSLAENSSCPVFSADLGPLGVQNTSIFCDLAPSLLLAVYAWLAICMFMTA